MFPIEAEAVNIVSLTFLEFLSNILSASPKPGMAILPGSFISLSAPLMNCASESAAGLIAMGLLLLEPEGDTTEEPVVVC